MPFFPLVPITIKNGDDIDIHCDSAKVKSLPLVRQTKMDEQQSSHSAEIAKLHKQIDELDNQIIRLQMAKR